MNKTHHMIIGRLGFAHKVLDSVVAVDNSFDKVGQTENLEYSFGMLRVVSEIRSRRLCTYWFVCVGKGPDTILRSIYILKEFPELWVEADHALEWNGSIAFAVKVERVNVVI